MLLLGACGGGGDSNQPPAADPQDLAAAQDVPLPVLLSGTDPDGDALSFAIATPPAHGALSGTPPVLTYTPSPGYSGPDGFTFSVSDGDASAGAAIAIAVVPATGPVVAGGAALDVALARVAWKYLHGGISLAIAKDGALVFARGYGLGDRAAGEPFEPDALARIASCSKPLAATAVMRLVEEGLLSHTAGFDPPIDPLFDQVRLAGLAGVPPPPTCRQIFGQFLYAKLAYAPGTRYAYSNLGFCALSLVVEKLTALPYQDAVRSDVLAPAGIHDVRFGGTRLADRAPGEVVYESGLARAVSVFPEDGGAWVPSAYGAWSIPTLGAACGWIASPTDLTRFLDALDGRGGGTALLAPGSLGAMATPGPFLSEVAYGRWTLGYGLGLFVAEDGTGARWWGHAGHLFPGTGCHMWANADGWSWAAVWNEAVTPVHEDVFNAVDAAIGAGITGSPSDLYPSFPSPDLGSYLGL